MKFEPLPVAGAYAIELELLRERGATVHVIGEAKTPEALRNASDQFFQWTPPEASPSADAAPQPAKPPLRPMPPIPTSTSVQRWPSPMARW